MTRREDRPEPARDAARAPCFNLDELAPVGYCAISGQGLILAANLTAATLLGVALGALVRQPITRFIVPEDQDIYCRFCKQLLATGAPQTCELRLRKQDETVFWANLAATAAPDADGAPVYRVVMSDVTERKRAEEVRQESEKRYRTLFETMAQGVVYQTAEGYISAANPAAERILGLSLDQMRGKTSLDPSWRSIHEDGSPFAGEDHPSMVALRTGETVAGVIMGVYHPHSGEYRWLMIDAVPEFLPGGTRPRSVYTTFTDITERRQVEENLRVKDRAIETAINAKAIADLAGKLTYVNPAFLAMWGYADSQEVLGKHVSGFWRFQEDAERVIQLLQAGGGWVGELMAARKDGSCFEVQVSASLVTNDAGEPIAMLASFLDITERKRAEEARDKLQSQLLQAQKMESVGRLAGGVAHDFNNMLAVILGHVDMALEQVDPAQPLFANLQEIRKAAERSANLTRQLLAFARKQTVAPRVLDLNETVAGMLKMLHRLLGEDIDLVWRPGTGLGPVKMDPAQIDQVLANLCVNARDAISGVGKITIETEAVVLDDAYCATHEGFIPGRYVLLAVSDDGCGMDRETLAQIFEPFFTTKGVSRGTGLGLATIYGIVKQNNGFINVYSEPGKGTTFKIYLPCHLGKEAAPLRQEGVAEPVRRGCETVLLVEDEPAILDMGKMMLESCGYRVLAAGTPGAAIRLAEEYAGEIHLLITDVVMPEMNGRDLARRLLSRYPHLKRLFMSGYPADIIAHQGVLDEGAPFIQKPFSISGLAAKVREVLD